MNCKKGDMAYLSSECVDEGKVVEVLSAFPIGPDELPAWQCRAKSPIRCLMAASGREVMERNMVIQDRYLRPILGLPVNEEVNEEITA